MRVAALCAGYGGLEMGLHLSGVDVDLVWYAEIDRHASQVMEHHHPGVPNLGDLTAIRGCEQVDIVTAGFPCQPVSQAGKRKGVNDERWLIDDVVRVACRAGARYLVCENVAGILTANDGDAMARVVSALAAGGFVAEWVCVRASDVGAPHQRLRWFCVAYADNGRREQRDPSIGGLSVVGEDGSQSAADASGSGLQGCGGERQSREGTGKEQVAGDSSNAANAIICGRNEGEQQPGNVCASDSERSATFFDRHCSDTVATRFGQYAQAVYWWQNIVGRLAPDPVDDQRRLNPRFVEWMMGLPDGWVCDAVEGRSHQLRILGNGVVPQQAALAITELLARLEDHE